MPQGDVEPDDLDMAPYAHSPALPIPDYAAVPDGPVLEPAAPPRALPELPPAPLPDRVHVSVRDPNGDWSLDVRRHDRGLDLVFSAPASLAHVITAAESDIRALLLSSGHSLASLQLADQGSSDRGGRPAPDPRAREASAPSKGPSTELNSVSTQGILINRVI